MATPDEGSPPKPNNRFINPSASSPGETETAPVTVLTSENQNQSAGMESQDWSTVGFKALDTGTTPSEMDGTPPRGWCRELPKGEK